MRKLLTAPDVLMTSNNMLSTSMQHFLQYHADDLGHVKAPVLQGC